MNAIHVNLGEQRRLHTCDVCGFTDIWTEGHREAERPVGKGASGYEVSFIICSEQCHNASEEPFTVWLAKYPYWTKKSARQNWNETIKNHYFSHDTTDRD